MQHARSEGIAQAKVSSTRATKTPADKRVRIVAIRDTSHQLRDFDREKADKDCSWEEDDIAGASEDNGLDHNWT